MEAMWIYEHQFRALGFRRKSSGYWSCFHRFGLQGEEHLSVFARTELGPIVEVTEFHVTIPVGENVHFYYHETTNGNFSPDGHTSSAELQRLGFDVSALRARADEIAGRFADRLGGNCLRRDWEP
jgi:hypothetical protein